jgi:hypothetical protein
MKYIRIVGEAPFTTLRFVMINKVIHIPEAEWTLDTVLELLRVNTMYGLTINYKAEINFTQLGDW